jgi:hypothetical protein
MKYILALLLTVSMPVMAGPYEDRAEALLTAAFGKSPQSSDIDSYLNYSVVAFQALIPAGDNPAEYTREQKAELFLHGVAHVMRDTNKRVAEQQAREAAKAAYEAAVQAAIESSAADL